MISGTTRIELETVRYSHVIFALPGALTALHDKTTVSSITCRSGVFLKRYLPLRSTQAVDEAHSRLQAQVRNGPCD